MPWNDCSPTSSMSDSRDLAEHVVAVACDDRYAAYAATTLLSAATASPADPFSLVVCTYGLNAKSLAYFKRVEALTKREVHVLDFAKSYESFPSGRYTSTMYLRFEVADRLRHSTRMLYLDCDILIRESLAPLLDLDMRGNAVAAAQDFADLCGGPFVEHHQSLGLPKGKKYFNSGVLVADLRSWREGGFRDQLLNTLASLGDRLTYPDQDAMNVVFQDSIRWLDLRWNAQLPLITTRMHYPDWKVELREATNHPAIVHFSAPTKPWNADSYIPFGGAYLKLLSEIAPDITLPRWGTRILGRARFAQGVLRSRLTSRLIAGRNALRSIVATQSTGNA